MPSVTSVQPSEPKLPLPTVSPSAGGEPFSEVLESTNAGGRDAPRKAPARPEPKKPEAESAAPASNGPQPKRAAGGESSPNASAADVGQDAEPECDCVDEVTTPSEGDAPVMDATSDVLPEVATETNVEGDASTPMVETAALDVEDPDPTTSPKLVVVTEPTGQQPEASVDVDPPVPPPTGVASTGVASTDSAEFAAPVAGTEAVIPAVAPAAAEDAISGSEAAVAPEALPQPAPVALSPAPSPPTSSAADGETQFVGTSPKPIAAGAAAPVKPEQASTPQQATPAANSSQANANTQPAVGLEPADQPQQEKPSPAVPKPQEAPIAKAVEQTGAPSLPADTAAPRPQPQPHAAMPTITLPEPVRALAATINPASLHAANVNEPNLVPLKGIELAAEIISRLREGVRRFDIRLDPPELGRVDVRLDVDRNGHATTRLTVDRPETLELLQREARGLERALQQAGLKTDQGGLEFSLRQQSNDGQAEGGSASAASQPDLVAADEGERLAAVINGYRLAAFARGGVDIRV